MPSNAKQSKQCGSLHAACGGRLGSGLGLLRFKGVNHPPVSAGPMAKACFSSRQSAEMAVPKPWAATPSRTSSAMKTTNAEAAGLRPAIQ